MNAPLSAAVPLPASAASFCLIVNPQSFAASRRGLAARAVELARRLGIPVVEFRDPSAALGGLEGRLLAGLRRIAVLAGDGTVQALVDHLAHLPDAIARPQLLVLAGGRTNLTARDLDGGGDVLRKLQSAFRRHMAGDEFRVQSRSLLAVEQAGAPTRHGFFVAGGGVEQVIRACHRNRVGAGALQRGQAGTAWYLSRLALRRLGRRSILASPMLRLVTSDGERIEAPLRILLVTTLEHRRGAFDPYSGRGQGGLRFTAIARGARRFWLRLPAVVCGRFGATMTPEAGYLSGRADHVTLQGLRHYALDGEEFEADPSRPLVIRRGPPLEFLRP